MDKPTTEFYKNNPQGALQSYCKECNTAAQRRWRSSNLERSRAAYRRDSLKKNYGITVEEYDAMSLKQGNVCAVCGDACPTGKRLAVDHNHATGVIRGLLCLECNTGLGKFKDDTGLLFKAALYVSKHQ